MPQLLCHQHHITTHPHTYTTRAPRIHHKVGLVALDLSNSEAEDAAVEAGCDEVNTFMIFVDGGYLRATSLCHRR